MKHHEKWEELADLYSVGALDGGDISEFRGHLKSGCTLCEARIAESEFALSFLTQGLPQAQVSPALKVRLMEALDAENEPALIPAGFSPVWAASAWVLISAMIVFGWQFTQAKRHTAEFHRMEAVMAHAHPHALDLKPMDAKVQAAAKVMWDEKGECVFMTMGLPQPAKGKTYQLWGITGDQKVSAGVIAVDAHGCGFLVLNQWAPKNFEKMAVTLEPAGGVPSPTGPLVLLGALGL